MSLNGQSYTWDNNGNLLSDGFNTYTYNDANRLTGIQNTLFEIQNEYNGDGLRVGSYFGETYTRYTYNVNTPLPVLLAAAQNESLSHYYYGLGQIAERSGAAWSYRLADALGSTRQVTGAAGDLTASYQYDPFGQTANAWPDPPTTSFLFTGEQIDPSNLYYLRARYYDPRTGRFTQIDPFPGLLTLPDTLNPYLYTLNNPATFVDPSGKFPLLFELLLIGAFAGGMYRVLDYWFSTSSFNMGCLLLNFAYGAIEGAIWSLAAYIMLNGMLFFHIPEGLAYIIAGAFGGFASSWFSNYRP